MSNRPRNFQNNKGVNELARKAGVSITTASRKLRQGKTPDEIIREALLWKARQDKEDKKAKDQDEETFSEAQRRKEVALANKYELENKIKLNELAPIGEVNAWVSGMILRARDIMVRISPELCDRLAK